MSLTLGTKLPLSRVAEQSAGLQSGVPITTILDERIPPVDEGYCRALDRTMFTWARSSELRKMGEAGIPGATYDDWLDGWGEAVMHKIASTFWGEVVVVTDDDREACFSKADPEHAFDFVKRLTEAAATVPEGGAIAWRHYYVFAEDHRNLNSVLEPAAVFQHLYARGFHSLEGSSNGAGKADIYSNPDTLFVHHGPILKRGGPMKRITRIACAMYLPSRSE